jgi:hypothetical protein
VRTRPDPWPFEGRFSVPRAIVMMPRVIRR